jgi:hypothetical protein
VLAEADHLGLPRGHDCLLDRAVATHRQGALGDPRERLVGHGGRGRLVDYPLVLGDEGPFLWVNVVATRDDGSGVAGRYCAADRLLTLTGPGWR